MRHPHRQPAQHRQLHRMRPIPHYHRPPTPHPRQARPRHRPRIGHKQTDLRLIAPGPRHLRDGDTQYLDPGGEVLGEHLRAEGRTHGLVAGLGAAVDGGVGDEGVGRRADIEDQAGMRGGVEAGQQGAGQLGGEAGIGVERVVDLVGGGGGQGLDDLAAGDVVHQDGEVEIRNAGREGGDVGARGAGGVEDGGAEAAGGKFLAEGGGDGGELGGVAAVEDDVEAVLGEFVGERFADAVAGAGDAGPGVGRGAVDVAGKGGGAEVEVDEAGQAEEEEGKGEGAECGHRCLRAPKPEL